MARKKKIVLTPSQQEAFDAVKAGKNVFITGSGGNGKSFLTTQINDYQQEQGRTVLVTASTGRAALLLGGVTAHRALSIPIKMAWCANLPKTTVLAGVDAVIIDEVSMLRMDAFDYAMRVIEQENELRLAGIRKKSVPIQIIAVGDFAQLPPVLINAKDGTLSESKLLSDYYGFDVGGAYAFQASMWEQCELQTCPLREPMRHANPEMVKALEKIRFGDRESLIYFMDCAGHVAKTDSGIVLCGTNRTADDINVEALARIKGRARIYESEISGMVDTADKMAPDMIPLKVGAQVIMLLNTNDYKNGSAATITALHDDYVTVEIQDNHRIVDVGYCLWPVERYVFRKIGDEEKLAREEVGRFSQLPLRLGYASTIHRSQGQTYDRVILKPEIFEYGQLYVALSRVRDISGLTIDGDISNVKKLASPKVKEFYGVGG